MSSASVKAFGASDSTECLLQKPDGERCQNKVHQVPPIELYERIKGFAKLCHKAVNHCHTRLKFTGTDRRRSLEAAVIKSIISSVRMFASNINTWSDENTKQRLGPRHETLQITTASQYLKFTFRNVAAIQYFYASAPFIIRFSTSLLSCVAVALQPRVLKAAITCLSL